MKIIIDIREPYEYRISHIDGAVNIPKDLLEQHIDYDGLGRDLEIENTFVSYDGGMVELVGY